MVHPLTIIRNTRDHDFSCLALTVDSSATPLAVRFEVHRQSPPTRMEIKEFTRDLIASSQGAVLDGRPGHDAVILQGSLPMATADAHLLVRYLYNGITGEWRQCGVTLRLGREGYWHLENGLRQQVPEVLVRTWSLPVIGTAGIQTLEGICTDPQA